MDSSIESNVCVPLPRVLFSFFCQQLAQVNTLIKGSIELPALMRSYDAAVAMQQWQQEKQPSGSGTPYYVLGAVASEGLGGGAMKARNNLERGGGGK
jgi:hypothetical protein